MLGRDVEHRGARLLAVGDTRGRPPRESAALAFGPPAADSKPCGALHDNVSCRGISPIRARPAAPE